MKLERIYTIKLGLHETELAHKLLLVLGRNNNQEVIMALHEMEKRIMGKISEFSDRVNTRFDQLGTSVDGIVTDIDGLKKKIEQLQNSPGAITPEDQVLLDGIEARANAIADKVDALDVSNPAETPAQPTPA